MTSKAAVVGFATLDFVLTTAQPLHGPGTVPANILADGSWPRAGGAALYAARRLAAAGHATWPIVSVGDDPNGLAYEEACRAAQVEIGGVVRRGGIKTPCCLLMYHDDGAYTCLLDLGSNAPTKLAQSQADIIRSSDMVVLAAANANVTRAVLGQLTTGQRVAWIAKNDPQCFPLDLCRELVRRSDFLFCNSSELHLVEQFLDEAKPGAILFETQGASGVRVRRGMHDQFVGALPVEVDDTTGAGDTFAGEVLASLLHGQDSPALAAQRAVDQVRRMLLERVR